MDKKEIDIYLEEFNKLFPNIPNIISNSLQVKRVERKKLLFCKGDRVEKIYILYDGVVKVSNFFKSGNIYEIGKNKGITFIGEQEVLSGNLSYSVTVETDTECIFFILEIDKFLQWIEKDIELNHFILKQLASRLYCSSSEKGNISYLSSKELVVVYLIKEYQVLQKERMVLEENQQELSEKIGISLRSLSRVISELKKEGLISIEKKKIMIDLPQYRMLLNSQK